MYIPRHINIVHITSYNPQNRNSSNLFTETFRLWVWRILPHGGEKTPVLFRIGHFFNLWLYLIVITPLDNDPIPPTPSSVFLSLSETGNRNVRSNSRRITFLDCLWIDLSTLHARSEGRDHRVLTHIFPSKPLFLIFLEFLIVSYIFTSLSLVKFLRQINRRLKVIKVIL